MKELMYSDIIELILKNYGFEYKKVKKIMPPFLNEQKWFLVEAKENEKKFKTLKEFSENIYKVTDKVITEKECEIYKIPKEMKGKVPVFYIGFGRNEKFTYLRPTKPTTEDLTTWEVKSEQYYMLEEIYILDFDLPYTDVLKTFSPTSSLPSRISEIEKNNKTKIKVINSLCLRLSPYDNLYFTTVPEPKEKIIDLNITSSKLTSWTVKDIVKKGHYITFLVDKIVFMYCEGEEGLDDMYISATALAPVYYEKGKIKSIYKEHLVDSIFLNKMFKIIEQILFILSKVSIIYIFRLKGEKSPFTEEFDKRSILYIFLEGPIRPGFARILGEIRHTGCYAKEDFINLLQKIVKLMWKEVLGEEIEFEGSLDGRIKEIERRVGFLEETLSLLGK